jgi:hypothetical protein
MDFKGLRVVAMPLLPISTLRYGIIKRDSEIMSLDHSFKVPKHVCLIEGEPLYEDLLTAVNEYGEVRLQVFTPTPDPE